MGSYLDYLTFVWVVWQFVEACRDPKMGPCALARFGFPLFVGHVVLALGNVIIN